MNPSYSLRDGMCRCRLNAKLFACSHTLSDNSITIRTVVLKFQRVLLLELVYYLGELIKGHAMQIRVY